MKTVATECGIPERKEAHPASSIQTQEETAGFRQLSSDELRIVVGGPVIQNDNT